MASTACSEACLAVYLHEKPFSVSRALAAHVTAPLSSGRAARSRRKSQLGYFLFRSVARLPGNQYLYGHKQLGMERTTTNSLVPFQPIPTVPTRPKQVKTRPTTYPGGTRYARGNRDPWKIYRDLLVIFKSREDSLVVRTNDRVSYHTYVQSKQ